MCKTVFYGIVLKLHSTIHLSFVVFLFERLTFVVLFFTFGNSDFYLCQTFGVDKKFRWNDGEPCVFRLSADFL